MTKVAEQAAERALELKKEQNLSKSIEGIGISGMEKEDLILPYMYIVQSGSEHAVYDDGKSAPAGHFFHNLKKKSYDSMKVIILRADKKNVEKTQDDGTVKIVQVWSVLMVPFDDLEDPFMISFKGTTNWYGWKFFLNILRAEKLLTVPHQVVVEMKTKTQEIKVGNNKTKTMYVPDFKIVGFTSEETMAELEKLAHITKDKATDEEEVSDADLDSALN